MCFSLVGNYLRPSNNSRPLNFNINAVVLIVISCKDLRKCIAPDKAAYCVLTQFRERENAIKFISVRTKTQIKILDTQFRTFS